MKVEVEQKSPVEKIVKIEVDADRYKPALSKLLRKVGRDINVPGFRRGKAPPGLILRRLGNDAVRADLFEDLIPQLSEEALISEKIIPLAIPECTNYLDIKFENGKPFSFELLVEVRPEFELTGYKGLTLENTPETVDVEEIMEKQINTLREQSAEMEPVEEERSLAKGDVAEVDFESLVDDKPVMGGSTEGYYMTMEESNFIPGFMEKLIGRSPGEDWEFDITFPGDYTNQELAGKEVHFKIHLHRIMKKKLPELDDEFAKSVGNYNTFQEMEDDTRDKINQTLKNKEKQALKEQIMEQLLEKVEDLVVPPSLTNYHLESLIKNLESQFQMMGKKLEDYIEEQNSDLDKFKSNFYPQAVNMAKMDLIQGKILDIEDIQVSGEDIDKEVAKVAARLGQEPSKIKDSMQKDGYLDNLRHSMLIEKIYDLIIENANIVEKSDDEAAGKEEMEPAEEEKTEVPVNKESEPVNMEKSEVEEEKSEAVAGEPEAEPVEQVPMP